MDNRDIDFDDNEKHEIDHDFCKTICQLVDNHQIDEIESLLNENNHTLDIHVSSSETLLMRAINTNENVAMLFVQKGADVNLSNSINTSFPLFEIAKKEKVKLGLFFISNGANIYKKNRNGIRSIDITSSTSPFKRMIDHIQQSDIPLIMLRDSLIYHDYNLFVSALSFKPNLSLFKYENKDILSFSLVQNVDERFFMKLIETGYLNSISQKNIRKLLYFYKEGFGHITTRNIIRYGFYSKILNKGVI